MSGFTPYSHLIPVTGAEVRVAVQLPKVGGIARRRAMKIFNQGANNVRVGFGDGPNPPTDDLQLIELFPHALANPNPQIDFQEGAPQGDIYITGLGGATTILVLFG